MYVRVQTCAPYTWCATTSQGGPRLAARGPGSMQGRPVGCGARHGALLSSGSSQGRNRVSLTAAALLVMANDRGVHGHDLRPSLGPLGAAVPEMGRGVCPAVSGVLLRLWSPVRGEYGAPVLGGDNQLYATRGQH